MYWLTWPSVVSAHASCTEASLYCPRPVTDRLTWIMYLLTGQFKQGWQCYQWRFSVKNLNKVSGCIKRFDSNEWKGESIDNKILLLYAEQGLVDVIQFVRYIPEIATKRSKIILMCQPELHELVKNVIGLSAIINSHEAIPNFDYQLALKDHPRRDFRRVIDGRGCDSREARAEKHEGEPRRGLLSWVSHRQSPAATNAAQ